MKNIAIASLFLFFLFACQEDVEYQIINPGEGGNSDSTDTITKNYFPQNINNSWNYGVTNLGQMETSFSGTTTVLGYTYNNLVNPQPIFGTPGQALVRKVNNSYYVTGNIDFSNIPNFPNIDIEEVNFLNENATNGALINEITYTVNLDPQEVTQSGVTLTVTPKVDVRVDIYQNDHHDLITLNGSSNYEDVLEYEWIYYIKLTLVFSNTGIIQIQDHVLLPESEVGSLLQYYANDIGVARSVFDLDFTNLDFNTLINTPAGQIDLAPYMADYINNFEQASVHQVSELIDYSVTN